MLVSYLPYQHDINSYINIIALA